MPTTAAAEVAFCVLGREGAVSVVAPSWRHVTLC